MTSLEKHALEELLKRELTSIMLSRDAISPVVNCPDETDLAIQFNQRRVEMALYQRQSHRVEELETTLTRLWKDDFGLCIECGKSIDARRIEARPATELCLRCQKSADRLMTACA